MALVTTDDKYYKELASGLRVCTGTQQKYKSSEMADAWMQAYANAYMDGERGGVEIGKELGKSEMNTLWVYKDITELNDPNIKTITDYQFYNFDMVERAIFPSVTSIGTWAFRNCTSLTEVDFQSAQTIGSYSFRGAKVRTFDFPKATSIGAQAFYGNSQLEALILRANTIAALDNVSAFTNSSVASGTGYIYVPSELVDSYKLATNWSTFANQILPISQLNV